MSFYLSEDNLSSKIYTSNNESADTGYQVMNSFRRNYPDLQLSNKTPIVLNVKRIQKGEVDPKIKGHFDSLQTVEVSGYLNAY